MHLFLRMSALICLLLVLFAAGIVAVFGLWQRGLSLGKTQVAVVIPESETKTRLLTRYASTMDSVKSICEFQYAASLEEAYDSLEEGSIDACLVFPENFYEDVDTGVNTPVTVYVRDLSGQSTRLFVRLLKDGISFLQVSEAGIYASMDTAQRFSTPVERSSLVDELLLGYAKALLKRNRWFDTTWMSPIGALRFEQHLYSSFVVFSLLLPGGFFGGLYKRQTRIVEQKLRIAGIGVGMVSLVRMFVMTGILWSCGVISYLAGVGLTSYGTSRLVFWDTMAIVAFVPIAFALAGIYHGIYGLLGDKSGVFCVIWLTLCLMLCSGMIVPLPFLSKGIQRLSDWLHLSFLHQAVCSLLYERMTFSVGLVMCLVAGIGGLMGAVGLWRRS